MVLFPAHVHLQKDVGAVTVSFSAHSLTHLLACERAHLLFARAKENSERKTKSQTHDARFRMMRGCYDLINLERALALALALE